MFIFFLFDGSLVIYVYFFGGSPDTLSREGGDSKFLSWVGDFAVSSFLETIIDFVLLHTMFWSYKTVLKTKTVFYLAKQFLENMALLY